MSRNRETVFLVENDPAMRESVGLLLRTEGYDVRDFEGAKAFLDLSDAELEGCCLISDIRMPDMDGFELLTALKERNTRLPVILLTAFADVGIAVQGMKQGAIDFLEKPFNDEALFTSVRNAVGESLTWSNRASARRSARAKLECLTDREREVLALLVDGKLSKIIAYELGIGVRTVESHRANIMQKSGVSSLAELVRVSYLAREE